MVMELYSTDTLFGVVYLYLTHVGHGTRLRHFYIHVPLLKKKINLQDRGTRGIEYSFTKQRDHSCSNSNSAFKN